MSASELFVWKESHCKHLVKRWGSDPQRYSPTVPLKRKTCKTMSGQIHAHSRWDDNAGFCVPVEAQTLQNDKLRHLSCLFEKQSHEQIIVKRWGSDPKRYSFMVPLELKTSKTMGVGQKFCANDCKTMTMFMRFRVFLFFLLTKTVLLSKHCKTMGFVYKRWAQKRPCSGHRVLVIGHIYIYIYIQVARGPGSYTKVG